MQAHITNVVTHFKGVCYAWHVVNEAVDDLHTAGYRDTVFSRTIGPDYIPIAFSAAAAADPDVKLYYTDYGLEILAEKANAVVNIVQDLQARGIKIDGVGLQGHNVVGATPSRSSLATTLRKFTALGLEVAWTEVEIRHSELPPDDSALQQQSNDYAALVGSCLDVPECVGITVWQFTDKYNWVPLSIATEGDACLWSKDYQRRPAYDGIVDLLRATINGTTNSTSAATSLSLGSTMGGLLGAAFSAWLLL
jgi:endo-1,4-beta-xylanase